MQKEKWSSGLRPAGLTAVLYAARASLAPVVTAGRSSGSGVLTHETKTIPAFRWQGLN
jgi:thioredoxin reductase